MSNVQLEQIKSLVTALHAIQERMEKSASIFPNHHEHLKARYEELLHQAKTKQVMPPWMAA